MTQEQIWDHERDQRAAVASIVGYCEGLAGSGILPIEAEMQLRRRIAAALSAFNMPSKAEHAEAHP